MNSISFDNPWLLFLIIPAVAVISIPFALAVRSDNRNGHNIASLVLHIVMAIIICFAAAGTSVITVITETQVYVLADVSYSANKNLDTVDGYIENLSKNLPRNSKMGVVCFANDCAVLTGLGEELKSVKTAELDETQTNIAEALEYTGKLFSGNVIKRIVLITDGKQSDLRATSSDLKRAVDGLTLAGVRVDAIYLDDNLSSETHEIQISSADFTRNAFLNAENNGVTALIQSNYNAPNMPVSLYSGNTLIESKIVNLIKGSNTVSFSLPDGAKGEFGYEIRLESLEQDEDYCSFNNKISFTQVVSDAVSVLLVTEKPENETYLREIYGEKSAIEAFTVQSNGAVTPDGFPYTVEELCAYDEIVLADVDLTKMYNYKMFIDSLDKVVSIFGKNLVTSGNLSIQNSQDEGLIKLGDMLPVRFGHNDGDPKLYTVVIDTSRSMETNNRLIMAKEATRQIRNLIGDSDNLCIVEFNGDVRVALPPTVAAKEDKINAVIDDLGVLQGTLIYKGLEEAYKQISALTMFKEKQVILISDGLSFSSESDDPVSIANAMRADGIKLSAIDVGRGGDYDTTAGAKRAVQLLHDIAGEDAERCAGKYFYTLTPEQLANIILTDIADDLNEPTVEVESTVIKNRRTDGVLEGFEEDAGKINGFVVSSAKGSAVTALKAEYLKEATGLNVQAPLYSYWTYGNGGVSSFTGSLVGAWSEGWINRDVFSENVLDTNVPSGKTDKPYLIETSTVGSYGRVHLTPLNLYTETTASVEVTSPDGSSETYELVPDGSGYYVEFPAPETGKYSIKINYLSDGARYDSEAILNVSYPAEYDLFASFTASDLYKVIGGNGTVSEDGNLKLENDIRDVGTYKYSLTVILLSLAAVIFVADIIVRKLKWADVKNLFVKVNKGK